MTQPRGYWQSCIGQTKELKTQIARCGESMQTLDLDLQDRSFLEEEEEEGGWLGG